MSIIQTCIEQAQASPGATTAFLGGGLALGTFLQRFLNLTGLVSRFFSNDSKAKIADLSADVRSVLDAFNKSDITGIIANLQKTVADLVDEVNKLKKPAVVA